MKWFYDLKINTKLLIGFIIVALLAGAVGLFGVINIKALEKSDTGLYEKMTVPISQLADIGISFQRVRINLRDMVESNNIEDIAKAEQTIIDLRKNIDTQSNEFDKTIISQSARDEYKAFLETRKTYGTIIAKVTELAKQNKDNEALAILNGTGKEAATAENEAIDKLIQAKIAMAKTTSDNNTKQANSTVLITVILIFVAMTLAIILGLFISKVISKHLKLAAHMIKEMSMGHLGMRLKLDTKDEVGQMALAMDSFADDLQNIVIGTMKKISEGDVSLDINVRDDKDEIAPALKITIEAIRELVAEAGMLSAAAIEGKLDTRGNADKFKGGYKQIVEGVNNTLDSVIGPLNVAAEYVDRISKGDVPPKITDNYKGDFNEIKNNLNTCIDAVNALVTDANMLAKAAVEGKLDTRADASKHGGDFGKIVAGVNNTLDSVIGPLNVAAEYVDRISKGDIPPKITDNYKGDFNEIKNNLNTCIDAVNALVTDANMLAQAAVDGNFDTRAQADKHQGDFRKVVEGVNATLDTVVDKVFWFEAILDSIPFPISVTDMSMNWTFINKATETLAGMKREEAVGKQCSKWNANICNTENCGIECLKNNRRQTVFEQNNKHFQVNTAYINNSKGEKIGHIEAIQDISTTVKSANYQKVEVDRMAKNLKYLSDGNLELDFDVAEGDSYTKLERENFLKINDNLKNARNSIDASIKEATLLSRAAVDGKLDTRIDVTKFMGAWGTLVSGMNNILEEMTKPLKEVTEVMEAMSNGILDISVKGSYKGDFDVLTKAVDNTASRLKIVVGEISSTLGQISDGNLTLEHVREFRGDFNSISNSLNMILDSLNNVLGDINSASDQVASGSRQVSDGSQALSQGATEQASSIEELSASITEIAAQTKQNAINANQANELALNAKENAAQGNEQMKEMLSSMVEINSSSANISKIIKVIDEIAFQTNILALNAAVEAARAGQHGKGFAVVAEEVRNLAARSASAAKETTSLIEGSINKVQTGTKIANETAVALNKIVVGVEKAANLVGDIASASNEQASGIAQINKGIEQVSEVVQTTSATAEESAASSEELSSQSELLKELVSRFKLKRSSKNQGRMEQNSFEYGVKKDLFSNKRDALIGTSLARTEAAAVGGKPRIALSDKEFGKY